MSFYGVVFSYHSHSIVRKIRSIFCEEELEVSSIDFSVVDHRVSKGFVSPSGVFGGYDCVGVAYVESDWDTGLSYPCNVNLWGSLLTISLLVFDRSIIIVLESFVAHHLIEMCKAFYAGACRVMAEEGSRSFNVEREYCGCSNEVCSHKARFDPETTYSREECMGLPFASHLIYAHIGQNRSKLRRKFNKQYVDGSSIC